MTGTSNRHQALPQTTRSHNNGYRNNYSYKPHVQIKEHLLKQLLGKSV